MKKFVTGQKLKGLSTNDGIDASMSALLPIKTIDMISYLQALVLLHQKLRSVLMTMFCLV